MQPHAFETVSKHVARHIGPIERSPLPLPKGGFTNPSDYDGISKAWDALRTHYQAIGTPLETALK